MHQNVISGERFLSTHPTAVYFTDEWGEELFGFSADC